MRYEVQTAFLGGGWENCWTVDDEPQTFDTIEAAEAAIDEFFADLDEAGMGDDYDRDDYRIVPIE